ncbi:hypothetical protein BpHYR1_034603 [Brachionus plicatilis]|uniref:Uncharacterized protein n=1 Tax=Brachionus plicatilis TaxID=10195 RepID=A0A3M7SZN9_BRAPC|nr:hypothetical protein BpHYR1_034603 [Brachionus plicatilis]
MLKHEKIFLGIYALKNRFSNSSLFCLLYILLLQKGPSIDLIYNTVLIIKTFFDQANLFVAQIVIINFTFVCRAPNANMLFFDKLILYSEISTRKIN